VAQGRNDLAIHFESAAPFDRKPARGPTITDLVVLTDSEEFQGAVEDAVSTQQRVWRVPTTDQAAELLAAGRVGVLVLDTECVPHGAPTLITRLNLEFPDLVVVVAGTHDEVSQFAHLVGEGLVYRFLQKPVSPARVRAFIDAAVRRHSELVAEAPAAVIARTKKRRARPRSFWKLLVGVAIIGTGYLMWHRSGPVSSVAVAPKVTAPLSTSTPAPTPVAPAAPIRQAAVPAANDEAARDQAAIDRAAAAAQSRMRAASSPVPPAKSPPATLAPSATKTIESPADSAQASPDPQVSQLLQDAEAILAAGTLDESQVGEAKMLLIKAMKLDPQNSPAQRSFQQLQDQMLTQARAGIARSDSSATNRWLAQAESLGVSTAELAPLRRSLVDAEQHQRTGRLSGLAKLAAQCLADDKLIEPEGDNARQYLQQLQTEDPALAAPLWQQFADRLLAKARRESSQGNYESADRWLKEAEDAGVIASTIASARAEVRAAQARAAFLANVVSSSRLKSTKYVPPAYPPKAIKAGLEGWVDVEFTVDTSGDVVDVDVKRAVPTGMFEKAAVDALAKWRFEPVIRAGVAVEQRVGVRVLFKLER